MMEESWLPERPSIKPLVRRMSPGAGLSTISTAPFTGVVFNYYVVGPEVIRFIDVDAASTISAGSGDMGLGSAYGQGDSVGLILKFFDWPVSDHPIRSTDIRSVRSGRADFAWGCCSSQASG